MRRFVLVAALIVVALAVTARPSAANGWCRTDPIIALDGRSASIWLTAEVFPDWQPGTVAIILVEIPLTVEAQVVYIDPNHGFQVFQVVFIPNPGLAETANRIDVRISVITANPWAPRTGVGVEWAMNAEGAPIAASAYGAIGRTLVLNTALRW